MKNWCQNFNVYCTITIINYSMCCTKQNCNSFCFAILTIFTLGASVGILSFAIYCCTYVKIDQAYDRLIIYVIVALCVSILILIFGLYSSCCGGNCSKTIMTVIYVVYGVALFALGIIAFSCKSKVMDKIGDLWKHNNTVVPDIEKKVGCCGWDNYTQECSETQELCSKLVEDLYTKWGYVVGGLLLGLSILLIVSSIVALVYAFKNNDNPYNHPDSNSKNQYDTPLDYNW